MNIIEQQKIFALIALATVGVLLVPLVAMQFTNEVNWVLADFIIMGALLFGVGSLFVLAARKISRKYRVFAAMFFAVLLLYVWTELAVGIFTHLGS